MKKLLGSFHLTTPFFVCTGLLSILFVASHFFAALWLPARLVFFAFLLACALETLFLYRLPTGLSAQRILPERLSNGDENLISITIQNGYEFSTDLEVIDEIPYQFQVRDRSFTVQVPSGKEHSIQYKLRPTERGVYAFGHLNIFASTQLGLVQRRYQFESPVSIPVYPSFLQMRSFEIMAASNRLQEFGVKKIRRIGNTLEFESIKEYVVGDDPRTVNWRATARRGELMVNQFQDEREQPMYCMIDAGRVMEMPFENLTLLDYSINASLVIGNVALKKQDRVGLISFSNKVDRVLPAASGMRQLGNLMERLYALETGYLETDYERLYSAVRHQIKQRSLILLFTNFESLAALKRQLPYLKAIARNHLLVVIFFENTELTSVASLPPTNVEAIYIKTIASQFLLQKQEIVMELRKHGIQSVLTRPEHLSVKTLNKYLELKARGLF
ncbi:MAG: DUF58 domain-containing protein [Rhodothermales bacterium]